MNFGQRPRKAQIKSSGFPVTKELQVKLLLYCSGFVTAQKEILNIQNAYADERFNKDFDSLTGYKTKTILCAPILNA